MKFLYIKGGNAITEVKKLAYFDGPIPSTGPDQFFLSIKEITNPYVLRTVTIGQISEKYKNDRLEAYTYGARSQGNRFTKLVKFVISALSFSWDTIRFRPKTIFCGLDGSFSIIVVIVAKICHSNLVYLSHNANNIKSVSRINKIANRFLVRNSDQIIVHGPFLMDQAISLGAEKFKIAEFDTWPTINHSSSQTYQPKQNDNRIVLYLGRIEKEKGVLDLLQAFEQVDTQNLDELWFIGTGAFLPIISKEIKQYKKHQQIKFLGSIPHEEINGYIQQSSFMVTPTQSSFPEGRCMSAMESLSSGKAVIAPNFGPFPWLIKDQFNGLLYQVDSVDDLARKISILLNDPILLDKLNINAQTNSLQNEEKQMSFYEVTQNIFNQLHGQTTT